MLCAERRMDGDEIDPYIPVPGRVRSVTKLTELETLFDVELLNGEPLGHRPGQFVQVSILGVGECPISVCTSPTRDASFGLCIRRAGEVTEHIHRLGTGDLVGIRGPLGTDFQPEELEGRNVVIVAGGCGLAPVRSLIQFILDGRSRFGSFHLLYGARSPKELLFREDLEAWGGSPDVRLLVTVDRADESWKNRTGPVTTLFSDLPVLEPSRTAAVVVGPPVMFKYVLQELLARKLTEHRIYCSLERRMKCGIGLCGHCQVNDLYVCRDGPVFRYRDLRNLPEAFE